MTIQDYMLALAVGIPLILAAGLPVVAAAHLAKALGLPSDRIGDGEYTSLYSFGIARFRDPFPKSKPLTLVYMISGVLWGASVGVRSWRPLLGYEGGWALGVAPSFFAGVTLTLIVAGSLKFRPLFAMVYGATLMLLAEVVQLFIPRYVYDPLDVLAGFLGATLATIFLVSIRSSPPSIPEIRDAA